MLPPMSPYNSDTYTSELTLKEWSDANPTTNPFVGCINITALGGADLYWDEFKYRYKYREIYEPDEFVSAVQRVFRYNEYKFSKLLASTNLEYDPLNNYMVLKTGSEKNTVNMSKSKTGTDTVTPDLTKTETPNTTRTETETPTVKTRETVTPNISSTVTRTPNLTKDTTETPRVKVQETETPGVSTSSTVVPADYTDNLSKSTYDDTQLYPVSSNARVHDNQHPQTQTITPTGTNTKVTEPVNGTNKTEEKETGTETTTTTNNGTQTKNFEVVSGNNQTTTTQSGSVITKQTGTEKTQYGSNVNDSGTETLEYLNRTDKGYMYRNPQDVVEDERKIALFSLLDVILADVEQATLISVY